MKNFIILLKNKNKVAFNTKILILLENTRHYMSFLLILFYIKN